MSPRGGKTLGKLTFLQIKLLQLPTKNVTFFTIKTRKIKNSDLLKLGTKGLHSQYSTYAKVLIK